jgi:hypothetical protein
MTRLIVIAGMLLGLCSCGPQIRPGAVVVGGFNAFSELMTSYVGTFLIARRLCDRDKSELLAAPGEALEFGSDFTCPTPEDTQRMRAYCVVGFGDPESRTAAGLQKATVFSPQVQEDLQDLCKTARTMVSELTPHAGPPVRLAFYFSTEPQPVGELLRLVFVAEIRCEGRLAITCESASPVDVCEVEFSDPPSVRPSVGSTSSE